ncbi:MAG: HAD-IIIC family phosphatase [Bacteriovoracaceae bacterium]
MKIDEEFNAFKKNLESSPSFSTYTALGNFAEKNATELKLARTKISVLRNFTVEPLMPIINGEIILSGSIADNYINDFDTIPENVLNLDSDFYKSNPDYILIMQWLEILSPLLSQSFLTLSTEQVAAETKRIVELTDLFFKSIRSKTGAAILINNFPLPTFPTLGILDAQTEHYQTYTLIKLNMELMKISQKYPGIYWVDFMGVFARYGSANNIDPKHWHMSKAPLGRGIINEIGLEYGKFFKSFLGKTKKCLVLDCDNTLWGGVVGEDGLGGIKLGSTYPGQIFKDFQQEILNLYHRGVILALCSKNNEPDIFEVLENHPEMILKKHHFAAHQINWDDKATNLERIAKDLNIGIDSLVFVDDNPFECNWVKEKLPEVKVIELGKDLLTIKRKLESAGLFDSLVFSAEDKKRNELYNLDKERKSMLNSSGSMEDYLKSLELEATFGKVTALELPRAAQLTQKTNQFNLTTKRYTEAEVNQFIQDEDKEVYFINLRDKISDLGIIGVAMVQFKQKLAHIDTFLLSCRALGRGTEDTLLKLILNRAKLRGCEKIQGSYIESAKNAQVKDFYQKRHFQLISNHNNNIKQTIWELDLTNSDLSYPVWIKNSPTNQLKINF